MANAPQSTGTNPEPNPAGGEPDSKPGAGGEAFDPSKLSDADFDKIFTDDRLYRHPRFKSLNERAKQAEKLQKEKEEADKKKLEEDGKHQELAQQVQKENETLKQQIQDQALKNSILVHAGQLGIVDPEAAAALIDKSGITHGDDGSVSGVKEALEALVESKPYLKGQPTQQPVGTPSNPNPQQTETGAKKFKLSQIQDSKFYKENEKDILEAMSKNMIEDDIHGTGAGASTPTGQAT